MQPLQTTHPTGRSRAHHVAGPGASAAGPGVAGAASRARAIAAATPVGRDRYVDFLRVACIAVVVAGHWLMAAITWQGSRAGGSNALDAVHGAWLASWLLQVMPVFFFVGGFSNQVAAAGVARRGGSYVDYLHGRLRRLSRPVIPFLGAWLAVALLAPRLGASPELLRQASGLAVKPLWFLGVYTAMVALAPPMARLHARFGLAVPVALAGAAALVDVAGHHGGLTSVAILDYLFVWLFAQQLGFFYADGRLRHCSRRRLLGLAGAGLAALALLTGSGAYPGSMVGVPGDRFSNMDPPTSCILALTVWLVALVMLLREPLTRWLERPRAWAAVVAGGSVAMTVYLWHLSALLLGVLLLYPLGFPQPPTGSPAWWALRPLWLFALAAILGALVVLLGRFERPRRALPAPAATLPAASRTPHRVPREVVARARVAVAGLAAAHVALGIFGLTVAGLLPLSRGGVTLVGFASAPARDLGHLGLGLLLLQAVTAGSARRRGWLGAAAFTVGMLLGALGPRTAPDLALQAATLLAGTVALAGTLTTGGLRRRAQRRRRPGRRGEAVAYTVRHGGAP